MKIDKEEKYILDALEAGNLKLATPSKEEVEAIKSVAKKRAHDLTENKLRISPQ